MGFRHAARLLTAVMIATLVGGTAGIPLVSAQNQVTIWTEFATVTPGVGCTVNVSVDGGSGMAGARVALVVTSDYSGAVISTDSGTANDRGIVWLEISTSGTSAGDKAWAGVSINGVYLSGRTIRISDGGACSGSSQLVTMTGSIPRNSSASSGTSASSNSGAVIIPGAFGYQQERPLSCEYASLAIATGMLGKWVSEYNFESVVPRNDNPHWGYRGNIWGTWGNTTDYGVYAAPLVPALQQFGFQGYAFYGDRAELKRQIDLGRPTLVWFGARGGSGTFDAYTADGTRFQLTPYMHVAVIFGYDDWGVHVSDPGNGQITWWDWASFEAMWRVMDGMALAVHW